MTDAIVNAIRRRLAPATIPLMALVAAAGITPEQLRFASGTLEGWTVSGEADWGPQDSPAMMMPPDTPPMFVAHSNVKGEGATGTLCSDPFTIDAPLQSFYIVGADGTPSGRNNGDLNVVHLRSHPDGEILRRMRPPGTHVLTPAVWYTADLPGREVYLEVIDHNPMLRKDGFAWIGLADYRQVSLDLRDPVVRNDLYGLPTDDRAEVLVCRSLPFLAALPEDRGASRRLLTTETETIPVDAEAETLYLLGMINEGWDWGVAHWGEHPEIHATRTDQVQIGSRIGELEIRYESGGSDRIPLVIGATAWFVNSWSHGPSHSFGGTVQEPFASRPEYRRVLDQSLHLYEDPGRGGTTSRHAHYYLAVTPRRQRIRDLVVHDNTALRGRPLVSAVTLATSDPAEHLRPFGEWQAEADDLEPRIRSRWPGRAFRYVDDLAGLLYTHDRDLPKRVEPVPFPDDLDATRVRFLGTREADMLSNVWTQNLALLDRKFVAETGVFHESAPDGPWYGGYSGVGTWTPAGIYYGDDETAFARCSDHFASLVLRCIHNPRRRDRYVDYVDRWLYFFRHDHDPANGPPNDNLDLERYPDDAPPHWCFVINGPLSIEVNEIHGNEETDGHGATMVGRWLAWRLAGAPTDEWLTAPRSEVYGKSRWDATRDAAEFVCWFMDYTGMDVMFCEGETTGWGGNGIPPGMGTETDPGKIRRNYANANMYEPYPTWVCAVALRCSADVAEALDETEQAARWRSYADRLQQGMMRLLRVGDHSKSMWRVSPHSVYPSLQDSLVHAWFSIYRDGVDPTTWDPGMTAVTRNTLERQLGRRYGRAPVLAMGYGQGWLTKAALVLDDMNAAGEMLWNIARYSYDKNMDHADPERGIDWRQWLWIIPEGTNILPDGSWYRIGDLSNGANQGPAMHALAVAAGLYMETPQGLRLMPRVPEPLHGVEVENAFVLVPGNAGLDLARVNYRYERGKGLALSSDIPLPGLAVRLGPYADRRAAETAAGRIRGLPQDAGTRTQALGNLGRDQAWWLWIEGLADCSTLDLDL